MIPRVLQNWVWEGIAPPVLEKLDVFEDGAEDDANLVDELSLEVRKLVSRIDGMREAYERRLAAELTGRGGAPEGRSEGESYRKLALSLLPSLDALDRIVEYGEKHKSTDEIFQNWLKTVVALRLRLRKTLEGIGLAPISSVGSEVDLDIHDVVAIVPAKDYLPNTVIEERQKGYYFRGKLLRDAKVVVAQ